MAKERKAPAKDRANRKGGTGKLAELAPKSATITAYDEAHFALYLALLDAQSKAASETAMIEIVLESAPRMRRDRARRALRSHLKRAMWMSEEGYRGLLGTKPRRSP
jgi:hypothetical protein